MQVETAEAVWDARRELGVGLLPRARALPEGPVRDVVLGWIALVDGRPDDALDLLRDASRRLGPDDIWRARAVRMLGDVLGDIGDDLAAEENYVEAMRLFDLHGDMYGKVSTLQISASLGYHSPATATARLQEALDLAEPLDDTELLAIILTTLGEMASADKQTEQARVWIEHALTYVEQLPPDLRGRAVAVLAKIEFEEGHPDLAAERLALVDLHDESYGSPTRILLARQFARLYCLRGETDVAIRTLEAQLRPPMHPLMELPLQEGLSEAHEADGDLRAALRAARRVGVINAELQANSATRRAAALDAWHRNHELRSKNEWAAMQIDTLEQAMDELKRAHDAIHEMSITDALTGIRNRTHLLAEAPRALETASDTTPAQVAVIDIDSFKHVNDTYGHAAGDQVLRAVAVVLTRHTRTGDLVCRHGGDEFVVIRSAQDTSSLVDDMETLRGALAAERVAIVLDDGTTTVPVGLSVGVVQVARPSLDAALSAADALMYRSKRSGRGQVVADRQTPLEPIG